MDNINNKEFKKMDDELEKVSTRTRSETEKHNQNNKNDIFITSMKVVAEEKAAKNNLNSKY